MISKFLTLGLALLPTLAMAAVERPDARRTPIATPPVAQAAPQEGPQSQWVLLPNIALQDVLYPAPTGGNPAGRASVVGTTSTTLKTGHSVLMTTIRLENQGETAKTRPVDYLRCYEYFTPTFNQAGTRCFVLRPRTAG